FSTRMRFDDQQWPLFPLRVIDTNHRRQAHTGTGYRGVLDIDRADPLATGLDHILGAVGDAHEAKLTEGSDVAGVEPAIGVQRTGFTAEIALDGPGAPYHQGAGALAVSRQALAMLVHHLQFDAVLQAALATPDHVINRLFAEFGQLRSRRRHHAQRAGLGHAPQLAHGHAVLVLILLGHGPRYRRASDDQVGQLAGILAGLFQVVQVHGPDGRHATGEGHTFVLDQLLQALTI